MILYEQGLFGLTNLSRVHGSAVYKVIIPSAFSTGMLLIYNHAAFEEQWKTRYEHVFQNPYAVGAIVGFFSFLLTFRLNFAYGRYWEGATAIHQMLSKWLDTAMDMAAFHYQSRQFDDIYPKAFGNYPNVHADQVVGLERGFEVSEQETIENIEFCLEDMEEKEKQKGRWFPNVFRRRRNKNKVTSPTSTASSKVKSINAPTTTHENDTNAFGERRIPIPQRFQEQFTLGLGGRQSNRPSLVKQSRASIKLIKARSKIPSPSLFLQETAHLVSLLAAVAMASLRDDIEGCDLPLTNFVPGEPWPPVDPDELSSEIKHQYGEDRAFWRLVYFLFGLSRSERHRTLYNAARPFGVLGGVSDSEMEMLQNARGPYAKLSLVSMWLQEFLSREYLNGSTGDVGHPIISRLYQFISDGTVGYNHARKIAYVPFPFPHAQITSFFSLVIIFLFPLLFYTYVNQLGFACVLNSVTVLCFLGLHEVARELEDPFQNVPNDLPLTTFQAQLNEALVTMYAGYHPDAWWELAPERTEVSDIEEEEAVSLDEGSEELSES